MTPRSSGRCERSTSRHGSTGNRPRSIGSSVTKRRFTRPAPGAARRGRRRRGRRRPRSASGPRRRDRRPPPARSRRPHRRAPRRPRPRSTTESRASAPSSSAACTKVSGAGLPGRPRSVATAPLTTVPKRSARPAASSTAGALAEEETTASGIPEPAQVVQQRHRARVGHDAVAGQHLVERVVLAVAQLADPLLGQVDAPRGQEVAHAVVAGLAVDVGEVVGVGVGRAVRRGTVVGAQEGVEHLRPGPHVHLGGRRDDAVEVEAARRRGLSRSRSSPRRG